MAKANNKPKSDDNRDNTNKHLLIKRILKSEKPRINITEFIKSNNSSNNLSLSDFPNINNIY
jgi:hypothetical protein